MALIGCPECHKRISETALACPHCGYILTLESIAAQKEADEKAAQELAEAAAVVDRESRFYKTIAIGAALILFVPLIISAMVNGIDTSGYHESYTGATDEDGRYMWRYMTGQLTEAEKSHLEAMEMIERAKHRQ